MCDFAAKFCNKSFKKSAWDTLVPHLVQHANNEGNHMKAYSVGLIYALPPTGNIVRQTSKAVTLNGPGGIWADDTYPKNGFFVSGPNRNLHLKSQLSTGMQPKHLWGSSFRRGPRQYLLGWKMPSCGGWQLPNEVRWLPLLSTEIPSTLLLISFVRRFLIRELFLFPFVCWNGLSRSKQLIAETHTLPKQLSS